MKQTAQSETGILYHTYLKDIKAGFISQKKIDEEWNKLNYLSQPDYSSAINEYDNFKNTLEEHGVRISYFIEDQTCSIDSIYCRDASIVTDHGVVLCNMGKQERKPEPFAQSKIYQANNINILGSIESPGTIEGGDVAWLDQNTLAVAHGYRTNQSGFDQLKKLLSPFDIELIQVHLPHYKGPSDVFHLMSIFSPVGEKHAVVYSPLMPVKFRNLLIKRGYQLIEVPDEEFESMGCNVLSLTPTKCLMVAGSPLTKNRIKEVGLQVIEYKGQNISVLGGGGPTCLTRPISRVV